MKTIYYFILFCWLVFVVSCSQNQSIEEPTIPCESAQSTWDGKRPADSWIYTTTGLTEEMSDGKWSDAFQVPSNVLKQMSTQAVIQAILDYPFLLEIYAGSNWSFQFGFEITFTNLVHPKANHAYIELCKREDAGKALLDRLLLTDPITDLTPKPPFGSQTIELLLSQAVFLSQVKDQADDIVRLALRNDELRRKDKMWDVTDGVTLGKIVSETITPLLIGRTIFVAEYAPFLETINSNQLMKIFLDGWYPLGYFAHAPNEVYPVGYYPSYEFYGLHPDIFDLSKKFLTNK